MGNKVATTKDSFKYDTEKDSDGDTKIVAKEIPRALLRAEDVVLHTTSGVKVTFQCKMKTHFASKTELIIDTTPRKQQEGCTRKDNWPGSDEFALIIAELNRRLQVKSTPPERSNLSETAETAKPDEPPEQTGGNAETAKPTDEPTEPAPTHFRFGDDEEWIAVVYADPDCDDDDDDDSDDEDSKKIEISDDNLVRILVKSKTDNRVKLHTQALPRALMGKARKIETKSGVQIKFSKHERTNAERFSLGKRRFVICTTDSGPGTTGITSEKIWKKHGSTIARAITELNQRLQVNDENREWIRYDDNDPWICPDADDDDADDADDADDSPAMSTVME